MIENDDDTKALSLLEKAVYKAQESLSKTKNFQPFLMLLTDAGEIEIFENELEDSMESYELLEKELIERMKKEDVNILILAVDTIIPDKFSEEISSGIRLHLEEKSQRNKTIGGRFLYVPYELCQVENEALFVKLHAPIPVGFPAEYII